VKQKHPKSTSKITINNKIIDEQWASFNDVNATLAFTANRERRK